MGGKIICPAFSLTLFLSFVLEFCTNNINSSSNRDPGVGLVLVHVPGLKLYFSRGFISPTSLDNLKVHSSELKSAHAF